MEKALKEYCDSLTLVYKFKSTLNHFKGRRDKDDFEYQVISYAESEIKRLEKKIALLKQKWHIKY